MVTEDLTNESTGNRSPFLCGDWLVEPALNRLSRGDTRVDIEPKAMNALVYLADRPGEVVTTDALIEHVWGARYVVDTAVYKAIAQLRRVLGDDSRSPTYIATIRKRGYRLIAPVSAPVGTAKPPAPRGHADSAATAQRLPGRGLLWLGAAASLILVSLLFVVGRDDVSAPAGSVQVTPAAPGNSIAVLPFENMSDDDATDYFSDGLSEEILNSLAQIPRLRVAARTSSFYFKDRNADIAEIGAVLKVQSVLEGSVRKEGSTLRVTAQLIDAASGYHLWSETFDRQDSDLLSVQTEIAEKVAAALQNRLLGSSGAFDRRSITVSVEAYDAYLYGKQELERRSAASLERAIESLLEAIEFDPEFAEAYTALAHAYLLQHYYSQRAAEEVYAPAIAALDRAQELDPDLPYARQIRGTAAIVAMDLAAAIGILNEAIEATPNDAGSWRSLGFAHVLNGDLKLAEIAYETANDLDPLNATLLYNVGAVQMLRGNFDRGAAIFERVAAISPDQRASTKRYLSGWAGRYGRYEEAAVTLTEAQGVSPSEALFARVRLLIDLGLWDEAELRLEQSSVIADYEPVTETGKILLRQGRYSELDERFGARNAVFTDDDGAGALLPQMRQRHFWRGMAKLVAGRYGEAQEAFLAAAGEPAELSLSDIEYLPHLAYAYQLDGKDASADEILRIGDELVVKAMQQGWNTPSFKMKTARLLSVQGDTVAAVDELRAAVEQGWLVAGDLDHDPIWQPLRDDPDFIDLVAEVERRLEPMRSNVLRTLDEAQYRSRVHSQ